MAAEVSTADAGLLGRARLSCRPDVEKDIEEVIITS
jgi:hypothetical protein